MGDHPIRLVVADDLRRSRLTVGFRFLLAFPHFFWMGVWTIGAFVAVVLSWFATLVRGTPPRKLHDFLAGYVRYTTHVNAYVFLAANPFPGFLGHAGSYPVDVEIAGPQRQHRLGVAFRLFLAVPAILLVAGLVGGVGGVARGSAVAVYVGGAAFTVAFLAWFASLVRGRMPEGFRDLLVYALRYAAQVDAYLFLLSGRYPNSDPAGPDVRFEPRLHPVRMAVADDGRRSRLTVFFRLLLGLPHLVWLTLWSVAALVAAFANWVATLVSGRSPRPLHRFLAAYIRYQTHVMAFLTLAANAFPGFTGAPARYPVDLAVDPPERQRRLVTAFRLLLAVPAFLVASALGYLLYAAAFLGWFASLATGRMPGGLRALQAYVLRYSGQTSAYAYMLTDRYPYSGPPA